LDIVDPVRMALLGAESVVSPEVFQSRLPTTTCRPTGRGCSLTHDPDRQVTVGEFGQVELDLRGLLAD